MVASLPACGKPGPATAAAPTAAIAAADADALRDKMCAQLAPAITDCALADQSSADEPIAPDELERLTAAHTKSMFAACRKEVAPGTAKQTDWQTCLASHHAGAMCAELETCLAADE